MLADGPPRRLGHTGAPLEIVELPRDVFPQQRYLRLHDHPLYELSPTCETCPPLFRQLAEVQSPERLSSAEFKERLAIGLGALDEDILRVMSGVLPPGEYLPLLLRLWPTRVLPGEAGDYFADERAASFELDGIDDQPSGPYYRGTSRQWSDHVQLFEFILPLASSASLNPARVIHYQALIHDGLAPTALALSILDGSVGEISDHQVAPLHWSLGHFLLDGHHKIRAAAELGGPLNLLCVLSTSMGKARRDAVMQLACELAGHEWAGSDLLR